MAPGRRLVAVVLAVVVTASCQYPALPALERDATADATADRTTDDPIDAGGDAIQYPDDAATLVCGDGPSLTAIGTPAGMLQDLALGVGSGGDAIATWTADWHGWTARFAPATGGWSSEPHATNYTWGVAGVGVGRRGDALVASTFDGLWAYHLAPGETFASPGIRVLLRSAEGPPRVAVGDDGHAMMVWAGTPSGRSLVGVWAQRVDPAQGWGGMVLLGPEGTSAHPPQLAATGSGDAIVSWRERPASSTRLLVRRYQVAQAGWSDAHPLAQATDISAAPAAFDRRRTPIIAWNELRDGHQDLRAAAADGDGWGAVHTLATDVGHGEPPLLLVAPSGDVTVLWRQGQSADLWGATRTESSWSAPAVVIARSDGAGPARVASDEHGNATAAWPRCNGGSCGIEVVRRAASDGVWRRIEASYVSSASGDQLALAVGASERSAFVAWQTQSPYAICVARVW
jgi:hypothetical protein